MSNSNPKKSIRVLLAEIVDYAGLFPPSQVSMPEAVSNYATYKNSNYNWMLGRFIVPVGRLDEFLESAGDFFSKDGKDIWRLSVLAGGDIYETVSAVKDFNAKNVSFAVCDALEVKSGASLEIEKIANAVAGNLPVYVELPLNDDLSNLVSGLAINQLRAKIRTGGTTPEAFPSVSKIIRFVQAALTANVPFKATAGLHHPFRCLKPLTYETGAPEGIMNGFLSLFLATGFARQGFDTSILEELMNDESAKNFAFNESGVCWRQEHFLSNEQLANLRRDIISFGSCSFTEPIEDLQEIEIL